MDIRSGLSPGTEPRGETSPYPPGCPLPPSLPWPSQILLHLQQNCDERTCLLSLHRPGSPGGATLRGAGHRWTPNAPVRRDANGSAKPRPTRPLARPGPFPIPVAPATKLGRGDSLRYPIPRNLRASASHLRLNSEGEGLAANSAQINSDFRKETSVGIASRSHSPVDIPSGLSAGPEPLGETLPYPPGCPTSQLSASPPPHLPCFPVVPNGSSASLRP